MVRAGNVQAVEEEGWSMRRILFALVPLVGMLNAKYPKEGLLGDLLAGLTVGVMLVPQGIAYALLAGLPAEIGLYASIVPIFTYAVFGSSRQLAVGPVALVSLLISTSVSEMAEVGSDDYVRIAVGAALMVGILQAFLGITRLGYFVNFLSAAVVGGFTAAAAVIIATSQVKHVLGVSVDRHHYWVETIYHTAAELPETNGYALLFGLVTIAFLLSLKQFKRRFPVLRFVPGAFVVLVIGTAISYATYDEADPLVKVVGTIPDGYPAPQAPSLSREEIIQLLPSVVVISMVGFLESISVAKIYAAENKYEVVPNTELFALGVANVMGSFFNAFPVTGGFSRTAVNAQAGAKTTMASLLSATVVLVSVLAATPLLFYLPMPVLGGIIIAAVIGLIHIAELVHLWKVKRSDAGLWLLSAVATLGIGVELGILVAVGASLLLVLQRTAIPHYAIEGRLPVSGAWRNILRYPDAEVFDGVVVVRFDADIYFGNVEFVKGIIGNIPVRMPGTHTVVVDATAIIGMDAAAAFGIAQLLKTMCKKDDDVQTRVFFAAMKGPVRDVFARGEIDLVAFKTVDDAVSAALEDADGSNV